MTQEEKLLLKDLCARLPYDVMVDYESHTYILNEIDPAGKDIDYITVRIQDIKRSMCAKNVMIENIKPYLRPLSSMTEEEAVEIDSMGFAYWTTMINNDLRSRGPMSLLDAIITHHKMVKLIDWLNAHHFDYRGLIEKGLALEAPEGMYNLKVK